MKQLRKITDNNKGFITFCLVLFFLTAGFAKGIVVKLPVHHTKGEGFKSPSKHILSTFTEAGNGLSFLDQLRDGDADDVDFVFFGGYTYPKFLTPEFAEANFSQFAPYNEKYSVALYDLYCNWKHHLS